MGVIMKLTEQQKDLQRVVCSCIIFRVKIIETFDEVQDPNIIYCADPSHQNYMHIKVLGARHWDSTMRSQVLRLKSFYSEVQELEQGFIDQSGNFLSRGLALEIAKRQNQIIRPEACTAKELFSEALY